METYGGRLSSSTRSRSVQNSHHTAANMLVKEEKFLDKLKSSSQRSMGREEEKLKKRLEKIELERSKSPSRGYLDQDNEEEFIRSMSRSGTSMTGGSQRRESLPGTGPPRLPLGAGRQRAMSLAAGQEEMLARKSVTFVGSCKKPLVEKISDEAPSIVVTDHDPKDDVPHKVGAHDPKHQAGTSVSSTTGAHENIHDLFDMAIQTVASSNDSEFRTSSGILEGKKQKPHSHSDISNRRQSHGSHPHVAAPTSKATLDLKALKELEEILKDSRLYSTKKCRQLDGSHDSSIMRQQKKRMLQLEQLLSSLKIGQKKEAPPVKFDPMEVLNCTYLRLSRSNVESLERMVRESGRDPGIHAHSDVTDFKLFDDKAEDADPVGP
ncbi:uncharacterized protein LOC124119150 [Haliotis rufescens]|uniref:uncharacterized protein LOC124119150 n=1 Tax=Haliotis rufescens TaxID=6454 RepID=UPI00201EA7CF|nr:uncharacterized protein LOC124119150 [Haliotis rufescens]